MKTNPKFSLCCFKAQFKISQITTQVAENRMHHEVYTLAQVLLRSKCASVISTKSHSYRQQISSLTTQDQATQNNNQQRNQAKQNNNNFRVSRVYQKEEGTSRKSQTRLGIVSPPPFDFFLFLALCLFSLRFLFQFYSQIFSNSFQFCLAKLNT